MSAPCALYILGLVGGRWAWGSSPARARRVDARPDVHARDAEHLARCRRGGDGLARCRAAAMPRRRRRSASSASRARALSARERRRLAHGPPRRTPGAPTRRATARASCRRGPFAEGERVTVRASALAAGAARVPHRARSTGSRSPSRIAISSTPETIHPGRPSEVQGFRSRPDLHPPVVDGDGAGLPRRRPAIVRRAIRRAGPGGPMILDPSGGLVWFKALPARRSRRRTCRCSRYAGRAGADVVAGRHLGARVRARRRRDRRRRVHRDRRKSMPATACRRTCTTSSSPRRARR